MSAKRMLDWTDFLHSGRKFEKFLPFYKNTSPFLHGDTLYSCLKYRDNLNLPLSIPLDRPDGYTPEYEYVPYENYSHGPGNGLYSSVGDKKKEAILFSLLKQHHIFAVYKISEQHTVDFIRNEVLIPLYDKIYGLDSCWAFLSFLNRIDSEHVSIEIFLFGIAEIDRLVLIDITSSFLLHTVRAGRLEPHNAMYWFYKLNIFFYHNPAVLKGAALLITLYTKPLWKDFWKLFYKLNDCEIENTLFPGSWSAIFYMFEHMINDDIRDSYWGGSHLFTDFIQLGPEFRHFFSSVGASLDYTIQFALSITEEEAWWGIDAEPLNTADLVIKALAQTGSEKEKALLQEFLKKDNITFDMKWKFVESTVKKEWLSNFWAQRKAKRAAQSADYKKRLI